MLKKRWGGKGVIKFIKVDCLKGMFASAGVAQWTERRPVHQRVTGLIPSQGTCLGCGPGPQRGAHEKQPRIDVSLPLFLLLSPLSKDK